MSKFGSHERNREVEKTNSFIANNPKYGKEALTKLKIASKAKGGERYPSRGS